MSTKEKRDRLFKGGRPIIRELNLYQDGAVSKDVGVIWAAYKRKSLPNFPEGMNETQFLEFVSHISESKSIFIADDFNRQYSGMGPIGTIYIKSDTWNIEPHAVFFPWATTRNKLRSSVAFFQMVRYKKIGACIVYCTIESRALFDKTSEYGVLQYRTNIPNAEPEGDRYIFSVRGTKNGRS